MSAKTPSTYRDRVSVAMVLSCALFVSGCALFGEKRAPPVLFRQRVYFAPPVEVERALKQAMIRYPQKIDNPEAGIFETDWIKGDLRFQPAHSSVNYSDGYRYRLLVRMVKGKSTSKPAVKVVINKQIELQRDFFAEPETVGSDGLEETAILYRIQRELALEKAIKRAQEKANSSRSSSTEDDESAEGSTGD